MNDAERNEELQAHFVQLSGRDQHTSTCATSVAPAFEAGPCDCRADDAERPARQHAVRTDQALLDYVLGQGAPARLDMDKLRAAMAAGSGDQGLD